MFPGVVKPTVSSLLFCGVGIVLCLFNLLHYVIWWLHRSVTPWNYPILSIIPHFCPGKPNCNQASLSSGILAQLKSQIKNECGQTLSHAQLVGDSTAAPLFMLSVNSILGHCVVLWNILIHNEDFHTGEIKTRNARFYALIRFDSKEIWSYLLVMNDSTLGSISKREHLPNSLK